MVSESTVEYFKIGSNRQSDTENIRYWKTLSGNSFLIILYKILILLPSYILRTHTRGSMMNIFLRIFSQLWKENFLNLNAENFIFKNMPRNGEKCWCVVEGGKIDNASKKRRLCFFSVLLRSQVNFILS